MATETELKFRIPAHRLPALRRAVATRSAVLQPLAASYVDTPGQHLARARCALRLRREGDTWVQTLKAEGASALQRLEHNVVLPGDASGATTRPALDTSRHAGTPAGERLRQLLADAGPGQPLVERYATEVQRTRRLLRSGGAVIELALDEGAVLAGPRRQALCELEFELVSGPPQALLALAGRWAQRHGLLLDVRSKSELGHTLAAGLDGSPPTPARPLRRAGHLTTTARPLHRAGHLTTTARPLHRAAAADCGALLAQALRPVLANASQIAAGPAGPGHLQQLRRALVRLRRLLAAGGRRSAWAVPLATLLPALRLLCRQLDAAGDAAAVQAASLAVLPGAVPDLLRQPATQQLWLGLLGLGLAAP